MRRFDKKKNIEKVNALAEQRYLKSKGLLKEDFPHSYTDDMENQTNDGYYEKAYDSMEGETIDDEAIQEETSSLSPINKYVQFCFNYPPNFIQEIFGDNNVGNHLQSKFDNYYSKHGSIGVMSVFYMELDSDNRKMLEDYILNN
jgi:hypothetical protein